MLHITEDESGTYKICRLLPCEYDVIDGRKEGYVFLRRYGHDAQGNYRVFVRAYFTKPRFISKEFTSDMELSNRFQRELISMSDGECEVIYDVNTGCPIYADDGRNLILGAYHTKNGTVVQQAGALAQDRETEKGKLLSIDGAGVKSYDYAGATHKVGNALFGAGVFSINSVEVEGESNALGFIVGEDRGLRVLNEHLQPMSDKYFSHVSIITSIAGTDVSGDTTVLSLNPMQMGEDDIEFY